MRLQLEYGRSGLDVELPDEHIVATLRYADAAPLPAPDQSLRRALSQPTGTPSLAELAHGRSDACILICDITRPVPNGLFLRPLIQRLH